MAKARTTTGTPSKAKASAAKSAGARTIKAPARSASKKAAAAGSASSNKSQKSTTQPTLAGAESQGIISSEDRRRMIQDAAYHIAEKDGFQHGREQDYWLRAEQQVDQLIKAHNVMGTGNQQIDSVDLSH